MAEVPEDRLAAALAARVSAYALTRATVAQDEDAAVFLVSEARRAGSLDLRVFNMAVRSARHTRGRRRRSARFSGAARRSASSVGGARSGRRACPRLYRGP
jgi:hypothetical protein